MKCLISESTYRLVRWLLGIVFIFAGSSKLIDPQSFAVLIDSYGIVPGSLIMPVAVGLPFLEVVAAVGLMFDVRGSLSVIGALLIVFAAILGYGIRMGLDVDCGCFGPEDPESRAYHGLRAALYRDAALLAGVIYLYALRVYRRKSPRNLVELISSIWKGETDMMKWMFWIFVGLGLILFGQGQAVGADKFEEEFAWEKISIGLHKQTLAGGYKLVGTEELKTWIDAKKDMIIIDTMPFDDSYKKEHIPGTKQFLFPIREMKAWDTKETAGMSEQDFIQMLGQDKNKLIVIYCGFVKCTRSHNGAAWAVKNGYANVYRYPGGIFAWKGAKHTTAGVE